jgi:hypothetical protein
MVASALVNRRISFNYNALRSHKRLRNAYVASFRERIPWQGRYSRER